MSHHVTFSIPFSSQHDAEVILHALSPEASQKIPKSETELSVKGTTLTLRIGAEDLSSLRAACNSYLRWIQTTMSVQDLVKKK